MSHEITLSNGSRIVCAPSRGPVRSYTEYVMEPFEIPFPDSDPVKTICDEIDEIVKDAGVSPPGWYVTRNPERFQPARPVTPPVQWIADLFVRQFAGEPVVFHTGSAIGKTKALRRAKIAFLAGERREGSVIPPRKITITKSIADGRDSAPSVLAAFLAIGLK